MPEAKSAAEVPRCTREERDPARDGASTGGTAPLAYFGVTQKGRSRPNNEDSFLVGAGADRNLFAVDDGMGGQRAGEVASFIATALLGRLGSEDPLEGVIRRANRSKVAARSDEELAGMGTTVVALRFSETREGPVGEVAHVGLAGLPPARRASAEAQRADLATEALHIPVSSVVDEAFTAAGQAATVSPLMSKPSATP